jgi:putative phosphoribosyl transferase
MKMFINRKDAARKLAHALNKYSNHNVVVLGIPRGGVEIAYYVAQQLNAEFFMIITRKLGHPENPEAAFGAIAEDGSVYLSEETAEFVTEEDMNTIIDLERKEIQRRIKILRKGKPLPDLKGKIVIIVDDGIATGATAFTAIMLCKKKLPGKIVIGAPIATRRIEYELRKMVDDVIILTKPNIFSAVSQGYHDFRNLSDEETIVFVDAWHNRLKNASCD